MLTEAKFREAMIDHSIEIEEHSFGCYRAMLAAAEAGTNART